MVQKNILENTIPLALDRDHASHQIVTMHHIEDLIDWPVTCSPLNGTENLDLILDEN